MKSIDKKLVCRRCNCLPKLVREEGRSDTIRCPSCGVFGESEEVRTRAAKYEAQSIVQNAFRKAFSKPSKYVTYRPGKRPSAPDFIFR